MNLILIISDTFRRDHVGTYGNAAIHTPNLDTLASESVVFDRAHCASFPTLLCRSEIFTGSFVFPYMDWGKLPQDAVLLSRTLDQAGYTCTMVTDNLPLCQPGWGYDRGFHNRIRIRGQWYDNFQAPDRPFTWPCPPEKLFVRKEDERLKQYLRNVSIRRGEEDCFTPQVVREAMHWLEHNHDRSPFFMYVDLFDPHQPWDPPQKYIDLYDPHGFGDDVILPVSPYARDYAPGDLKRLRALYAAEVSMVDHWVGKLLQMVDALGRREDTAIVFLSDHGIFLGERGLVGKSSGKKRALKGWPNYSEVGRIPMMFRVPGVQPGRRHAFVHPGDVTPTLLDVAGVKIPPTMKASSLLPVLNGQEEAVRDLSVSSWSLKGLSAYRPSVIRTDEWALVVWRTGIEPELYHLPTDPGETQNVYAQHRGVAAELNRKYIRFLQEHSAPVKNWLPRSWLLNWDRREKQSLMITQGEAAH